MPRFRGWCLLVCIASAFLTACGGGDSGASTGGSGVGNGVTNGALALSTSTLSFTAASPQSTPAAQVISANVAGDFGGTLYIRIVSSGPAVANISNVTVTGTNSGQATVVPASASSLGMGTYTATITVTACTTDINCSSGLIGTPQTINVTYTVNGIVVSPASLDWSVSDASPDADYSKTLQLTASPGWSVNSAPPELSLTPGSSSATVTNATVTVTLNRTLVAQLQSGTVQRTLTLQSASGQLVQIPVTIENVQPQLRYALPHVEPANEAGETILRGVYLNSITIGQIRFAPRGVVGAAGTPATGFTLVSPTEIHVQRPALAAGAWDVQFTDGSGNLVNRSFANIVTVDPPALPAEFLAYPSGPARHVVGLLFDAEGKRLLVGTQAPSVGASASELLMYFHTTGWTSPGVRSAEGLAGLAPLPSGDGFIATVARVLSSSPTNAFSTCTADFVSCADQMATSGANDQRTQIGMTNDGDAVVLTVPRPIPDAAAGAVLRYSVALGVLRGVNPPVTYLGVLGASEDGSRVVIGSTNTSVAGAQPLHRLDASTGSFTASPFTRSASRIVLNRDGSRVLVDARDVYDGDFGLLGSLPASTWVAVLARDGHTAYAYDANGTIRRYDLGAAPVGGVFPETGSGLTLAGDPGAGANGTDLQMALNPNGDTLFVAGSAGIAILPLP